MAVPVPVPGLVIRYCYLWLDEHALGREEGIKTRPCAIILTKRTEDGEEIVTVLPITHSFPKEKRYAIEIPAATKVRLGLDDQRSWIVLSTKPINSFGQGRICDRQLAGTYPA